jgi:5-methylcytosine-specific restriction endonuclease McrA
MSIFTDKFYKTRAWKNCRAGYIRQAGGLCERCLKEGRITPGKFVHHKIYLNADNIQCPEITLNYDNLELLCRECHEKEHARPKKRYSIDESGRVSAV